MQHSPLSRTLPQGSTVLFHAVKEMREGARKTEGLLRGYRSGQRYFVDSFGCSPATAPLANRGVLHGNYTFSDA